MCPSLNSKRKALAFEAQEPNTFSNENVPRGIFVIAHAI
jgi:hypothetical protein